jgi:hypothetical protein
MKKDRNCGMNMPMYPYPMPNMMPGIPQMGGMPYMDNNYTQNNYAQNDLSSLKNQISSLERRISNLENLVGSNNTTYNTTNYQML